MAETSTIRGPWRSPFWKVEFEVALKRSYDITIGYTIATGRWNMLLSGGCEWERVPGSMETSMNWGPLFELIDRQTQGIANLCVY